MHHVVGTFARSCAPFHRPIDEIFFTFDDGLVHPFPNCPAASEASMENDMTLHRSALFAAAFAIASLMAQAAQSAELAASKPAAVVFICEHGISKSLVAAMLFNRIAEQRGLAVRAVSRAVSPQTVASNVPAGLMQNLDLDGFPVKDFRPQAVTPSETSGAARVVVIGYDGNVGAIGTAAAEHWDDVPAASLEYDGAKQKITSHIETLLRQLDAGR